MRTAVLLVAFLPIALSAGELKVTAPISSDDVQQICKLIGSNTGDSDVSIGGVLSSDYVRGAVARDSFQFAPGGTRVPSKLYERADLVAAVTTFKSQQPPTIYWLEKSPQGWKIVNQPEAPFNDVFEFTYHEQISAKAYQIGRQDAEKDVRQGRLMMETFGLPPPWFDDCAKLLNERYRIQVKKVAGCIINGEIVGHAKGYNEVSTAEIQRRFGRDILAKTQLEVRERWKKDQAK